MAKRPAYVCSGAYALMYPLQGLGAATQKIAGENDGFLGMGVRVGSGLGLHLQNRF